MMCKFRIELMVVATVLFQTANAEVPVPIRLRIEYGKAIVLNEKQSGDFFVFHGMADPLLFSSKANLTIWKVKSLDALRNVWSRQQASGIRRPKGVDTKMHRHVELLTHDITGNATFTVFDRTFSWLPGDICSGWILLPGGKRYEVAVVRGRHYFAPTEPFEFVGMKTHNRIIEEDRAKELSRGIPVDIGLED